MGENETENRAAIKKYKFPAKKFIFFDEDDLSRATKTSFSDDSDAFTRKMFNSCCWFLVRALLGVEIGHDRLEKRALLGETGEYFN